MGTQGQSTDIVFLSGRRTPFGTFGGTLKDMTATDLGVVAARSAIAEAGIDAGDVGHVIFGNALQTSSDSIYLARHVGLRAGVPQEVPALTVNRLCGSGFQAIVNGAQEILLGEADVALCGGAESMSQAPHVVRGARWGALKLGEAGGFFEDLLWQSLTDTGCGLSMAQTAERLAEQYGITREEADRLALLSQQRAKQAWDEGRFDAEVAPIMLETRKGEVEFRADEHMRPETTAEALAGLRPYFKKDGLVTAGNASGIGDGAAAVIIASARWAEGRGLQPLGRLVSWGLAGVDPSIMGIGPAPSSRNALARAGLSVDDMDLVEVNEAFAPQYAAVVRELELDVERTNVSGGAIALTHPLAASGARITVHLLHELRRRGGRYGLGTACIGGGQGAAVVVEAFGA
ncbi:MAG TPA: acetyl-CoA C-acetyltransferase [Longimicrobiales bacterium]|nr:acetyl-CoA C-acetyltransferase [Longimicrobiales bacterium]